MTARALQQRCSVRRAARARACAPPPARRAAAARHVSRERAGKRLHRSEQHALRVTEHPHEADSDDREREQERGPKLNPMSFHPYPHDPPSSVERAPTASVNGKNRIARTSASITMPSPATTTSVRRPDSIRSSCTLHCGDSRVTTRHFHQRNQRGQRQVAAIVATSGMQPASCGPSSVAHLVDRGPGCRELEQLTALDELDRERLDRRQRLVPTRHVHSPERRDVRLQEQARTPTTRRPRAR